MSLPSSIDILKIIQHYNKIHRNRMKINERINALRNIGPKTCTKCGTENEYYFRNCFRHYGCSSCQNSVQKSSVQIKFQISDKCLMIKKIRLCTEYNCQGIRLPLRYGADGDFFHFRCDTCGNEQFRFSKLLKIIIIFEIILFNLLCFFFTALV